MVIIWGLLRIRHKKYVPYIVLLQLANNTMWVLLTSTKKAPDSMLESNLMGEEDKILITLISLQAINYNTWRLTFWVYTLFLIPA
jgi:hypothetical protein